MRPFGANGEFLAAANEAGALRRLAVRGAGVTVLSGGLGQAIQIVASIVLARLVTPAEFGVVAMVTTFSLLVMNFGVNGFTEAVIQRERIDHSLASNLFWISVAAGLLLTAAFAAAGSAVAKFYNSPQVAPVAIGISATILITSTSVLHLALLQRALRFPAVSANVIVARAASVAVSILLAWAGWGCWALVAGAIVLPLSTAVGAFVLCRWLPGLPRRVDGTASMVRFAMHVYGRFTLNYSARNMDKVLVGWQFNAQALGFYKKAWDLFAFSAFLFVQSLTNVAVSALSRLKGDPIEYKRHLLSATAVTAFVGMGVGADLTLVGADVIRILLGPAWEPAGRIFTLFGPGIGVMFIYSINSWIHLSIGRADRWFRWTIVELATTGVLFVLGLPWGVAGIAVAWTASFWILTVPALWYAGAPISLGIGDVLASVWRYILASLLAACGTAGMLAGRAALAGSDWASAVLRIVMISSSFLALYIGAVAALHRGCAPLYQVARLLRDMTTWRGTREHRPEKDPAAGDRVRDSVLADFGWR